jgi:DNA modification methylase
MVKPISNTVKAKGHTPQYAMHKYFARRPYNVFRNLIEHYTLEKDIILDCFCGGGVTVFEGLSMNRRVIGVDINPLATFITEMQIKQVDIQELTEYFSNFYNKVYTELNDLYQHEIEGIKGSAEWVEWVYEVECNECGEIIPLSSENKITNGKYKCLNPKCKSNQTANVGVGRTKCKPYSSKPVRIKYENKISGQSYIHYFSDEEAKKVKDFCESLNIPDETFNIDFDIPKNWDRWYEDCLPQKGVYKFSDLFTKRNLYVNLMIFNKLLHLPKSNYKDILYFAFSSSLRYTNNMSRVTENWENGNPTCMDKHAYWLPNEYVECNVIKKLRERMDAVLKGLTYTNCNIIDKKEKANTFDELKEGKDYLILTRSSADLPIPNEAVDVIITDPPYGSNVQYGELSSFWNVWYMKYKKLDDFIFNDEEAVANRKKCFQGAKSIDFYGEMLYSVYKEASRVLKPEGYLVFTFNNKNINVWVQLLRAVVKAGFYLPENGIIYQDFIKEYENTSHLKYSGNIHGDFIYSFCKGEISQEYNELGNFENTLRMIIFKCIKKMYNDKQAYTTTELYERIFSSLVKILMQYIAAEGDEDNDRFEKIEDLSNDFIDNVLSQHLIFKDHKWTLKGDVDLC